MPTKKPDGKWHVDLRPDGAGGRRVRRSFETQAEAKRFEAFTLGQAAQGLPWNPSPVDPRRLSALISTWHTNHGQYLKEGTRRLAILESMCRAMGDPVAATMTPSDFTAYRATKRVERTDEPANPKTLNNHLGYINAVFNELYDTEVITYRTPFAKVKSIVIPQRPPFFLDHDQIHEVLELAARHSYNPDLYLCCWLCLSTGCRFGEAENLRRRLVINGTVTFTDTKGKKNRTVPISAELEAALLAHARPKQEWIFRDCMNSFDRIKTKLSFEIPRGQSTHVLRHTFASHFMMNGGSIVSLQKILGHVDIKSTMVYIHLAPGHLEQATEFNPLVGRIMDEKHSKKAAND